MTLERTLLGYRLTEPGVEHCRSHVPQDELLLTAKRLGFTVRVIGGSWCTDYAGSALKARSPGHLLDMVLLLVPPSAP